MLLSRPLPGRNEIHLQAECDKYVISLWLNHIYGQPDRIRVGELRYSSDTVIATIEGLYGFELIAQKDINEFVQMLVVRIMGVDVIRKYESPSYEEIRNDSFWKTFITDILGLAPIHFILEE